VIHDTAIDTEHEALSEQDANNLPAIATALKQLADEHGAHLNRFRCSEIGDITGLRAMDIGRYGTFFGFSLNEHLYPLGLRCVGYEDGYFTLDETRGPMS
jgi:hypothetical protein